MTNNTKKQTRQPYRGTRGKERIHGSPTDKADTRADLLQGFNN